MSLLRKKLIDYIKKALFNNQIKSREGGGGEPPPPKSSLLLSRQISNELRGQSRDLIPTLESK